MDEFRKKQNNPYSSQSKPLKQEVKFINDTVPAPQAPAHVPPPTYVDAPPATPTPAPTVRSVSTVPPAAHARPVTPSLAPTPPAPSAQQPAQTQSVATQEVPSLLEEPSMDWFDTTNQQTEPAPATTQTNAQPVASQTPITQQSVPTKTMDVVLPQPKKKTKLPKALIFVPLGLILMSAMVGGGYFLHSKEVATLQNQVDTFKQEASNIKAGKFGSTEGQGLSLLGAGSEGEVAGASTESDIVEDYIFNGQVVVRDGQLWMEVYVDTSVTGPVEALWANYGGSKANLNQQTTKTTEGLGSEEEGIVQMIAKVDLKEFEGGSSYLYRMTAKAKDGKQYKTGYAVFTVPQQQQQPGATTPNTPSANGSPL